MKSSSLKAIITGIKSIFLIAVFTLAANTMFAQNIKVTNVGVRAGANASNWHYNNSSSDDLTLKMRTNF